MKYLWTEDTGAGLHFWKLVNQLFFDNALVVSEYGTCNAKYGNRNNFTVNGGNQVKKGHKLSKTCTIWPWESNTHAYQIVKHVGSEIIKIKASIN